MEVQVLSGAPSLPMKIIYKPVLLSPSEIKEPGVYWQYHPKFGPQIIEIRDCGEGGLRYKGNIGLYPLSRLPAVPHLYGPLVPPQVVDLPTW